MAARRAKRIFILTLLVTVPVFCSDSCDSDSAKCYQDMIEKLLVESAKWTEPTNYGDEFQVQGDEENSEFWKTFDYIVVGAGTSGAVIASRLSEDPTIKVLVVETGTWENELTDVPGLAGYFQRSSYNWAFKSTPGKSSFLGLQEKRCRCPRGKALGGSSVINYIAYARPNKRDFKKWSLQCPNWQYRNVLEYFKKIENASMADVSLAYHGTKGPLHVEYQRYNSSLVDYFIKANEEMGRSRVDYNGRDQFGVSELQLTAVNGRRMSSAKAYLTASVRQRDNLKILDKTLATKILIADKRAFGIEFVRNGKPYHAESKKEVIISAGSFNTPQLLMLSGIGPRQHLQEHRIRCIQDLSVGQNLHDHPAYFPLYFSTNLSTIGETPLESIQNYLNGFGTLTVGSIAAIGFVQFRLIPFKTPRVEYLLVFGVAGPRFRTLIVDTMGFAEENYDWLLEPIQGKFGWSIVPVLQHPKSVGTVELASGDPTDFPKIDLNYFSDKENEDVGEMVRAIRDIFELSRTGPFRSIKSEYVGRPIPGCSGHEHLSDGYWECALRHVSTTLYHQSGTAAMGNLRNGRAVVDCKFKVRGIDGLRVADASVIPTTMNGHPQAICYAIGEMAVDHIKSDS